jgi:hypothetical protein
VTDVVSLDAAGGEFPNLQVRVLAHDFWKMHRPNERNWEGLSVRLWRQSVSHCP